MNIGKLNKRITIQQNATITDDEGTVIEGWQDFKKAWASIEPLTLKYREFMSAQALNSEITIQIKIRYTKEITPKMRVLYGTRVFEIIAVINPNEANIELDLMCKEVV